MKGSRFPFLKGSGLMSLFIAYTMCVSPIHTAVIQNGIQQGTTVAPTVPEHGEIILNGELEHTESVTYRVNMLEHGLRVLLKAIEGTVDGVYAHEENGTPLPIVSGQDTIIDPKPATSEPPSPTPTENPTPTPSDGTSPSPSDNPSPSPSDGPSPSPSDNPNPSPSDYPSPSPSDSPSSVPPIILNLSQHRQNQAYADDQIYITVVNTATTKSNFSLTINHVHESSSSTTLFVSVTNILLLVFAQYFFVN